MYKLTLIFSKVEGADIEAIEHRWSHEFVPLAETMPGLQLVSISRMNRSITPEAKVHLIHELYFEDLEALDAAMRSEQGQQAGRLLMDFAGKSVQVYFAEHKEDTPTPSAEGVPAKSDEHMP